MCPARRNILLAWLLPCLCSSTGIVLQDLSFNGCSSSAIIINATSQAPTVPLASTAAAAPADVLLQRVSFTNSSSTKGGALAVLHSRVVLDGCSFSGNMASGCGGAVYADRSALLVKESNFTNNLGNKCAIVISSKQPAACCSCPPATTGYGTCSCCQLLPLTAHTSKERS